MSESQAEGSLTKTLHCELCHRNISFTIKKSDFEDLKSNQLFSFVVVHANDHALVVSIDGYGNIRRTRVAMINEVKDLANRKKVADTEKIGITDVDNLADALRSFLKHRG